MPLIQIEPQRLYRQIAKELQSLIKSGEFQVGSRMPAERDLAAQLGVSRPSVREALIALEVEGVIEVRTGSGIYVKSIGKTRQLTSQKDQQVTDWGPMELMSARILIESEVAAQAASHASAADIKAMAKALKHMQQEVKKGQLPRTGDIAFHLAIAKACGNSVLLDTVEWYGQARSGKLFERMGDYFESPASWAIALQEHETIFHSIEIGDAQLARKSMQKHLRLSLKRFSISWKNLPAKTISSLRSD